MVVMTGFLAYDSYIEMVGVIYFTIERRFRGCKKLILEMEGFFPVLVRIYTLGQSATEL